MATTTKVEGVASTVKLLRSVDKKLAQRAVNDIKRPAIPAAAAVRAAAPAAPLSNLGGYGPTKAGVKYGGRAVGKERPLVRIRLTGPGWTIVSDMARRSSPGETMTRNLQAKWGGASRWVWPTVEARMPSMIAAIKDAVRQVEKDLNAALKAR